MAEDVGPYPIWHVAVSDLLIVSDRYEDIDPKL